MALPDCYDPVGQEERRQQVWDRFARRLPVCSCCAHTIYPGDRFYERSGIILCADCKVDLDDSERVLEEAWK